MVLLMMMIYIFALVFLQVILSYGHTEHADKIEYWFGTLFRTFLTLFECIVGGISWDEVVAPLLQDISPWFGIVFCIYISASLFAMMNLLTGVFVDKAMRSVREDKDMVLAKRIRDLFLPNDAAEGLEISREQFEEKVECSAMA